MFFALWPGEELRRTIEHDTRALARRSGGRIIPARNFHVTLVFLGSVAESRLPVVLRAVAGVQAPRFQLNLDRILALPGSGVLCLAPTASPPELRTLVEGLRAALTAEQFELERKVFRPHLTLVRRLGRLPPTAPLEAISWQVYDFVLVQSQTGEDGSEYEVLASWPLL